jgi:hypothetical protein
MAQEPPHSRGDDSTDGGRRLLVATGTALPSLETLPALVRGLVDAATDVLVITPVLPGRLQFWVSDTDQARIEADERLDALLGQIERLDASTEARVADEEPLTAFDDAVRDFRPDHILIALRADPDADWQERGLVDKVRERFGLPLTAFVVEDAAE